MSNTARSALAIVFGAMLPLLNSVAADSPERAPVKPQQLPGIEEATIEAFYGADSRSKVGPMHKIGYELTHLHALDALSAPLTTAKLRANQLAGLPFRQTVDSRHLVLVDATANGDVERLRSRLAQLGAENLSVHAPMVSGWVPIEVLDQIATSDSLRILRPSRAFSQTGSVTSQGDFAVRGPSVRPPLMPGGPTGFGVGVGVISDSYNCLGDAGIDTSNGEFPRGVTVIREDPGC